MFLITAYNRPRMAGVTEACPYLTVLPVATGNACKIAATVNEQIDGTLSRLPG